MKRLFLKDEFKKFWKKIENQENFALLRYGDGERAFMTGKSITAQEGWTSPDFVNSLGKSLLETLDATGENLFHGISCPCCDRAAYYWYLTRIKNKNITFSNLFININYKKFYKKFKNLKRDAIFIGNFRAKNKKIGNLNILKSYYVDDDCNEFWETKSKEFLEQIKKDYGKTNNLLYVISAGPMSEPIIVELYKNNPNNCYIDFGSAIDSYIHEKQTRPYMNKKSELAKKNCKMYPTDTKFDTTVVLTLFKRPEALEEQLSAIENQTLKPQKILLFHDKVQNGEEICLPEKLKKRVDTYIAVSKNVGVWGRFAAGLLADTTYVCFFDDDTIPGSRWLENCHSEMLKKQGLFGTIGIISRDFCHYPFKKFKRVGWDKPNKRRVQVDFAGHSWFLKKDWLGAMFINSNKYYKFRNVAEDAYLSFALKKFLHINTYVPPHPENNIELYGSIPQKAWEHGMKEVGISISPENLSKMQKALKMMKAEGMKTTQSFMEIKYAAIQILCCLIPLKALRKKIRNFLFEIFAI